MIFNRSTLRRLSSQAGCLSSPTEAPLFELAAKEAQQTLNLPSDHAKLTVLAAAAGVLQGQYNMLLPDGREVPLSLTVALQGATGPTTAFYERLINKSRVVMTAQMAQHGARLMSCANDWAHWQSQYETLQTQANHGGIAALMECQPEAPRLFQTHYEQMPWKEVYQGLQRNVPMATWLVHEHPDKLTLASLLSDITFTALANGDYPARLTTLMLYDNQAHHRSAFPGIRHVAYRAGMIYALQRGTLDPCLTPHAFQLHAPMLATETLATRLAARHRSNLALIYAPQMMKSLIEFSVSARAFWQDRLRVDATGRDDPPLIAQIGDTITPLGDTLARVAALLHLIEGGEGNIDVVTLHRACLICCPWLSDDLPSVLTSAKLPQQVADRPEQAPNRPQAGRRCALSVHRPSRTRLRLYRQDLDHTE